MDLQEVEVTIDRDGQVHVHVRGVKGQSCLEITRALEEALGGVVLSREMTPESLDQPNVLDNPDELWLTGKM
jgi:hypothetical protein